MFEKSTAKRATAKALVQVTLSNGQSVEGEVRLPKGEGFSSLLNDNKPFIELVTAGKVTRMVAKNSIVEAREVMRAPEETLDPYAILRLPHNASFAEVRDAWKKRMKACHPDRFASLGVDEEIQYAAKKASLKVNMAYDQICSEVRQAKKTAVEKRHRQQEPQAQPSYSVYV